MSGLGLALRFARRELRSGLAGFRIFLAALTLGVAAIAGVGSLGEAFLTGLSEHPRSAVGEGPRVELRIFNQRVHVDVVAVRPRPALDNVQGVAVWIGILVDPHLFVLEADRVDDQGVAFPAANLLAKERRGAHAYFFGGAAVTGGGGSGAGFR